MMLSFADPLFLVSSVRDEVRRRVLSWFHTGLLMYRIQSKHQVLPDVSTHPYAANNVL